ncbi:MAG: DUF1931 domain-containing protein [archaeon]
MSDTIIVKSKIKELVGNYNVSSDFSEELDKKVKLLIADAVKRAEANGRKTVMGKDI